MITTTVLKPHLAPHGVIVQRGETIVVEERRHRMLVKKGYVPRLDDEPADEPDDQPSERGVLTNGSIKTRRTKIVGNEAD
jgi:hypothetical protein